MDYELFENNIKNFFENKTNDYIDEINLSKPDLTLPHVSKFVNGYPDLQSQSVNVALYFFMTDSPNDYEFEEFASGSSMMTAKVQVYVVIKNLKLTTTSLDVAIKRYSEALDNLIADNKSMSNTVDYAFISGSHIFVAADTDANARALRKSISVQKEIRG